MEWLNILKNVFNTIGLSGILIGTSTFLLKRHFDRKDKKEEKEEQKEEEQDTIKTQIKELQGQIENQKEQINEINRLISINMESQQALLRNGIMDLYNVYYLEKKYFPIHMRESLDHMYKSYKELKGNGVIEDLVQSLMSLPTEPVED